MTTFAIYSVRCDGSSDKCRGWIAQEETAGAARRYAKRQGWQTGDAMSAPAFCPACLAERAA